MDFGNALQMTGRQAVEDYDLVNAVEKFRPELLAHGGHHTALNLFIEPGDVEDVLAADVAGHDDDGVAEVDGATLAIGQAAVVQHLQQHVEHLDVGLLDLIE